MAEPVSSIASAAAAGAGAFALSAFGLEPAPLLWALIGSSLGMSFAPAASRYRAFVVFVCVVLCCSLFGAWLAVKYTAGEQISRNAFACFLAIVFHPLLMAAIAALPKFIDSARQKLFGGASDA